MFLPVNVGMDAFLKMEKAIKVEKVEVPVGGVRACFYRKKDKTLFMVNKTLNPIKPLESFPTDMYLLVEDHSKKSPLCYKFPVIEKVEVGGYTAKGDYEIRKNQVSITDISSGLSVFSGADLSTIKKDIKAAKCKFVNFVADLDQYADYANDWTYAGTFNEISATPSMLKSIIPAILF